MKIEGREVRTFRSLAGRKIVARPRPEGSTAQFWALDAGLDRFPDRRYSPSHDPRSGHGQGADRNVNGTMGRDNPTDIRVQIVIEQPVVGIA